MEAYMPHFSNCCPNADTWICQVCAKIYCGGCVRSEWRPDITGHESAGNVCLTCLGKAVQPSIVATKKQLDFIRDLVKRKAVTPELQTQATSTLSKRDASKLITNLLALEDKQESQQRPEGWGTDPQYHPEQDNIGVYEWCRIESGGLEGPALDRYVNRYYGHN
jgi:hypothetical protein